MLSECDRSPNVGESQSLAPARPDPSNINSVRPPIVIEAMPPGSGIFRSSMKGPAEVRSPQLPVGEVTVVSCAV